MQILNLLTSGHIGGIEVLCKDIGIAAKCENTFCFVFDNGIIYEQMKKLGIRVFSFAQYKKLSLRKLGKIIKIAMDCDIIVVHHDDPFLQIYFILIKIFFPSKKFVAIVHHCYEPSTGIKKYGFFKRFLRKHILSLTFRVASKIVFVSKAGYNSFKNIFPLINSKSEVIYNGISNEMLKKGEYVEKKLNKTIKVLYIGRLVRSKGVDDLINAFSLLTNRYNISLDIVGNGIELDSLKRLVDNLNQSSKIKFWGSKIDVTPFLEEADIFVYPSKSEIFGISIVEAMAFKCICIANNIGGIPEIIKNNQNGLLNNSTSVDELTRILKYAIELCRNTPKRLELMKNARNTAEKFSINKTIKELKELYSRLYQK